MGDPSNCPSASMQWLFRGWAISLSLLVCCSLITAKYSSSLGVGGVGGRSLLSSSLHSEEVFMTLSSLMSVHSIQRANRETKNWEIAHSPEQPLHRGGWAIGGAPRNGRTAEYRPNSSQLKFPPKSPFLRFNYPSLRYLVFPAQQPSVAKE